MDPTSTTPTPPPDPSAAPAPQPAATPQTFTAEQVAERERVAAQKAHDAAEAAARKRYEERDRQRTSTPAPQPTPTPAASSGGGLTFKDLARFNAFNAATAEHGVPPAGAELLLERFETAKPGDVTTWVAEEAKRFGWSKPAPVNPNPTPGAQPGTAGSPASAIVPTPTPGGPPPAPSAGQFRAPVIRWSAAELDAYAAANGGPASISRLFAEDMARTRIAITRK